MKEKKEKKLWWLSFGIHCIHTGSREMCDPPPLDTDDDYLLLVDDNTVSALEKKLLEDGYTLGGSKFYGKAPKPLEAFPEIEDLGRKSGNIFHSYKKGEINLILTCSEEYFENFALATLLSKKLNLLRKSERITLFDAVLYDIWPEYNLVVEGVER